MVLLVDNVIFGEVIVVVWGGSRVGIAETLENEFTKLCDMGDAQIGSGGGHMQVTRDCYENG